MFEKLTTKNELNRTFSDAVFADDVEKVKSLFAESNTQIPNIDIDLVSGPAILLSAMKKKWDMFETLYNLNADLDVKIISNDWHLIHECVKNAPLKITETLSEYCDLNVQTETGKTPLMIAIREKNATIAELLIKTGKLDLSLFDKEGNNAAHYAADSGLNAIFLLLIKEGVPLNKKNKKEQYPADLIQDEFFKADIPKIIKEEKRTINVEKPLEDTITPKIILDEPKLTGLSSIKRKRD